MKSHPGRNIIASLVQAGNGHMCPPQKRNPHLGRRKMNSWVSCAARQEAQPIPVVTRRAVCSTATSLAISLAIQISDPAAANSADRRLYQAFLDAFSAQGFEAQDAAWTRAINLSPENSAAWSNRGTLRLQNNRWAAAQADLAHAVELEVQQKRGQQAAREGEGTDTAGPQGSNADAELQMVDPSTLNNLGGH
ncbi:hypothetical protein DUNSADRAFT_2839 [Dunaliella salina]|uniref:Tetratricopeptide repeat protein n=1 Tax=Dunaliella salina TaxID=3046 RepID=A0ABQ7GV31_DUNSA|nr:hypothetical protein DUNSADRAFT_2839 [Dunaliella salina]|eukprot:KAF5838445.1 hypothetical protein DUNSADRAFT_2839 [Dunaliella salina]